MNISTAVLCRPSTSFRNALAEQPYRTVYPSATVILIGSDMCEHPLGNGHSENGSDCCRVFGESRSDTFVVQNLALQNWSSADFVLFPCSKPARRPPLWSSGQSFWLQIQRSRVRFPALPDFLSSSGSGTGSTQPREVN